MTHSDPEIPLPGGYATAGIVRLGDTVRRPRGGNSKFVFDLLRQLEDAECNCVPRHLGFDDAGREILSFIPGEVFPKWRDYSPDQIAAGARLLRTFHDATRSSGLAGRHEAVCHYDPGPNNAIFRENLPCAWIDLDFAAPGPVLDDLGYFAWSWCISSNPARRAVKEQARMVELAAEAYGLEGFRRSALIDAVIGRLIANIDYWADNIRHPGRVPVTQEKAREIREWSLTEFAFVRAHRAIFERALSQV